MSKKKDYLPTHDHFYGAFAENPSYYFKEIYENTDVYRVYCEAFEKDLTSIENYQFNDFSFEVGSKSKGLWDLVIKVNAEGMKEKYRRGEYQEVEASANFALCIEYKTSIEESQINELLRQIENRNIPSYLKKHDTYTHAPVMVLVTFDQRFEKYRPVIENENISLVILDENKISDIKEKFDLSDSGGKESDLNSFQ